MTDKEPVVLKEPVAFAISKPSVLTPGDFLLFVNRPPSAFGGGGTAMFVVDSLVSTTTSGDYEGYCDYKLIVRFPKDTPYLLVARHLTIPLTMEELVAQQREEQVRWDTAAAEMVDKVPVAELTGDLNPMGESVTPGYGQYL